MGHLATHVLLSTDYNDLILTNFNVIIDTSVKHREATRYIGLQLTFLILIPESSELYMLQSKVLYHIKFQKKKNTEKMHYVLSVIHTALHSDSS